MNVLSTEFADVLIIENFSQYDIRGGFIKIFNKEQYQNIDLNLNFHEVYYSVSQKDVVRGMHFQLPPYDHEKIVHVIHGKVVDVLVDLRKDSPNYKKCLEVYLSGNEPKSIYIPKGFAHGFRALEDKTVMIYCVTSTYHPESDTGIAYDSIGYNWGTADLIVSERDRNLTKLSEFESPF